jgi:hypothetical protein
VYNDLFLKIILVRKPVFQHRHFTLKEGQANGGILETPFLIREMGFFISASAINKKAVSTKGGFPSFDLPEGFWEVIL